MEKDTTCVTLPCSEENTTSRTSEAMAMSIPIPWTMLLAISSFMVCVGSILILSNKRSLVFTISSLPVIYYQKYDFKYTWQVNPQKPGIVSSVWSEDLTN
jgi:ABC-type transport system involved in cytochrome c biogenesis permease subunit